MLAGPLWWDELWRRKGKHCASSCWGRAIYTFSSLIPRQCDVGLGTRIHVYVSLIPSPRPAFRYLLYRTESDRKLGGACERGYVDVAGEDSQPGTYYKTLDPQVDFG